MGFLDSLLYSDPILIEEMTKKARVASGAIDAFKITRALQGAIPSFSVLVTRPFGYFLGLVARRLGYPTGLTGQEGVFLVTVKYQRAIDGKVSLEIVEELDMNPTLQKFAALAAETQKEK